MEAISTTQIYRSLQSYWHQRAPYKRLEELPSKASSNKRIIRLGGEKKIKTTWKLGLVKKVRVPSPKRLLLNLRDAYVSCMVALAGGGGSGLPAETWAKTRRKRRTPRARGVKSSCSVKSGEFERRMMEHIYKSLVFAPREVVVASY